MIIYFVSVQVAQTSSPASWVRTGRFLCTGERFKASTWAVTCRAGTRRVSSQYMSLCKIHGNASASKELLKKLINNVYQNTCMCKWSMALSKLYVHVHACKCIYRSMFKSTFLQQGFLWYFFLWIFHVSVMTIHLYRSTFLQQVSQCTGSQVN